MKYTVTINEKSKTITVNRNGYEGVAKCCATDTFNLQTGIELALERAKVAEAEAKKPKVAISGKPMSVMELVKALEKALPKGQMVVVGNGKALTQKQKQYLVALGGGCSCENKKCCTATEDELEEVYDKGYDKGYEEGYDDGYTDGVDEAEDATEDYEARGEAILEAVKNILELD